MLVLFNDDNNANRSGTRELKLDAVGAQALGDSYGSKHFCLKDELDVYKKAMSSSALSEFAHQHPTTSETDSHMTRNVKRWLKSSDFDQQQQKDPLTTHKMAQIQQSPLPFSQSDLTNRGIKSQIAIQNARPNSTFKRSKSMNMVEFEKNYLEDQQQFQVARLDKCKSNSKIEQATKPLSLSTFSAFEPYERKGEFKLDKNVNNAEGCTCAKELRSSFFPPPPLPPKTSKVHLIQRYFKLNSNSISI